MFLKIIKEFKRSLKCFFFLFIYFVALGIISKSASEVQNLSNSFLTAQININIKDLCKSSTRAHFNIRPY